jgi:hypothetical protein
LDLAILLQSDLKNIDVLFYRMPANEGGNLLSNTDNFKSVSSYSRNSTEHGCSCVYESKYLQTEKVNCFQGISKEKDLKMIIAELLDYKFILMYIYRSLDGDLHIIQIIWNQ